jgi:probable phosphoglycerate mutase
MGLKVPDGITLYFARHGETEANASGRLQGHTRDTPLTAKGEDQARDVGKALLKYVRDPLDWVCSPLPRARATMEIARAAYGLRPGGYRIDDRLIEINMGNWEGLTRDEVKARFPGEFEARSKDKWNWRGTDGYESYSDVATRAEAFVASLTRDTFAMTHGAFIRILRGLFADIGWKGISELGEPQGCVFRVRGSAVERLDA